MLAEEQLRASGEGSGRLVPRTLRWNVPKRYCPCSSIAGLERAHPMKRRRSMNRQSIRALLLILSLCLSGFALVPRTAAAWDECFEEDEYEWRQDGCCGDGTTYFR